MKKYLQSFHLFEEEEMDAFIKMGTVRKLTKGDYFLKEGQHCKEIGFVKKGFFRSFFYNSQEEEVTYCFSFQNSFLTDYASFIRKAPARESIQALTDAELICFKVIDIDILQENSINWTKFSKRMAEQEFFRLEHRFFSHLKESAEHRYKELATQNPEFLRNIPLNYLASYLGISQRHLTRIRKSLL